MKEFYRTESLDGLRLAPSVHNRLSYVLRLANGSNALLDFDFEDSIGYAIFTTSHALRRALESELSEVGMTLRQWEVLACLACDEGFSQTEMADHLGIEPPTLAGVLRRMERDGWLERKACCNDRRRNRILATEKAEAVWKRTWEMCRGIREQATAGISDADIKRLKSMCQQIRVNLAEAGHTGAMAPCLDENVKRNGELNGIIAAETETVAT